MTLSIRELQEQAKEDTQIDKNKLDKYSLDLAKITSKWNVYMVDEKMIYESEFIKYSILKKKKYEYYSYDYQFQVSNGREMETYLNSDIELLKLKEKMIVSKEKLNFIEATVKTLQQSSFNVRNAIEFLKYQSGSY